MSKLVLITDATGNYWINPDNIVSVVEDMKGVYGCIVYTANPNVYLELRMSVGEFLRRIGS